MKLTIETKDETLSAEFTHIDVSVEEILQVLVGMLVSITYSEETVLNGMRDFLQQFEEVDEKETT